ncbi:hypothetical protein HKD37_07G018954 [Glycine soja]|uniref:Uncharacterized protein n=1 Tax=Glycine soja TaxID=3848 RepID=A0A0B2Q388_GLYSO|nr:hypothetical protein GmHk_07G019251 [Glycine max]KHN14252.1 hypothetical protein glysoja_047072 [Glycine soja]
MKQVGEEALSVIDCYRSDLSLEFGSGMALVLLYIYRMVLEVRALIFAFKFLRAFVINDN